MMKKNTNKGVTIVMLVITIIVMIIMTSFAIFYSTNIAPEARIAATFSSLKEVKTACHRALNEIEMDPANLDEYTFFGKNIYQDYTSSQIDELRVRCGLTNPEENDFSERTYIISGSEEENVRRRVEKLEITNLGNFEFVADLGNDKYYVIDGVERIDDVNPSNSKIAYEYRDIELLYSMLTSTKR